MARGPGIEPNSPRCAFGEALLDLFTRTCLSDPKYVDRLRKHYELFKAAGHRPDARAR
jgi:hypothetical protein